MTSPTDTPTPETDKAQFRKGAMAPVADSRNFVVLADFARTLERQLADSNLRLHAERENIRLETLARQKAVEERDELMVVLQRANPPPERAYECLTILDAAGMGKEGGSPHGNTLTGMVQEICTQLSAANVRVEELTRERDAWANADKAKKQGSFETWAQLWMQRNQLIQDMEPVLAERDALTAENARLREDKARLDYCDTQIDLEPGYYVLRFPVSESTTIRAAIDAALQPKPETQ